MSPIHSDGALATNEYPDAIEGDNDAINAFLTDPEEDEDARNEPSDNEEEGEDEDNREDGDNDDEADDEASDQDDPDGDEDSDEDEGGEDDKTKAKKFADDSDDTYVKIKVGDEDHEVSVKDLKRLWGQEASLTRKSQEVAADRTAVDTDRAKNVAAYNVMLQKATARADQYRAIPWTQLMKDPDFPAEQLTALQAEATAALEDEAFIKTELDGFMTHIADQQKAQRATAARDCITALTNPESPAHIKGWNETVYNDIRAFGVEMGLDKDTVNNLTDPGAFKVLHMAMQFKRGAAKVQTKKVNKTPTKIVKNSASAPAARSSSKVVTAKSAVAKAKRTGTQEDAMAAFLALDGED